MKYWCYNEPPGSDGAGNKVIVVSDDDIIRDYWPWWSSKMIEKYGEKYFKEHFCKYDCIDDFVVVHWAWESK